MRYKIVIDQKEIEICAINAGDRFPIYCDGSYLGYVTLLPNCERKEIWYGSTALLDKFAGVIGGYILRSDCSFYAE